MHTFGLVSYRWTVFVGLFFLLLPAGLHLLRIHLVFFGVDGVRVIQKFVQDVIEKGRDSMVQVLRVERVLLHFMELVALKDITQESVMSFLEAFQVVLEHLVLSFDDLNLT